MLREWSWWRPAVVSRHAPTCGPGWSRSSRTSDMRRCQWSSSTLREFVVFELDLMLVVLRLQTQGDAASGTDRSTRTRE